MLEDIKKDAEQRMGKCVVALRNDLKKLRTGRAHPSLRRAHQRRLLRQRVPLKQVANVTVEDARTLAVTPVGQVHGAGDREGDHEVRSGLKPNTAGR